MFDDRRMPTRAVPIFLRRNVVPAEIQHMPCTGGLVPGDRVAALRQLLVVPKGRWGNGALGAAGSHRFSWEYPGHPLVI